MNSDWYPIPLRRCGLWLLALMLVSGCDRGPADAPPRVVVTGEVTWEGTPVSKGTIRFIPHPDQDLPVAGAVIRDGRFHADNKGGVPVGRHRVEITAVRPAEDVSLEEVTDAIPEEQYLPAKFNTDSELELEIKQGAGSLEQNFHLD